MNMICIKIQKQVFKFDYIFLKYTSLKKMNLKPEIDSASVMVYFGRFNFIFCYLFLFFRYFCCWVIVLHKPLYINGLQTISLLFCER